MKLTKKFLLEHALPYVAMFGVGVVAWHFDQRLWFLAIVGLLAGGQAIQTITIMYMRSTINSQRESNKKLIELLFDITSDARITQQALERARHELARLGVAFAPKERDKEELS